MPVNKVVEIFDNTDNLPHWQKGLESYNLVSGTKGIPGAKIVVVPGAAHLVNIDRPKEFNQAVMEFLGKL